MRFFLDIGKNDPYYQYAAEFHAFLEPRGVNHTWITPEGSHTDAYWADHTAEYLRWYVEGWQAGCDG
jgi:hypothetical protein